MKKNQIEFLDYLSQKIEFNKYFNGLYIKFIKLTRIFL